MHNLRRPFRAYAVDNTDGELAWNHTESCKKGQSKIYTVKGIVIHTVLLCFVFRLACPHRRKQSGLMCPALSWSQANSRWFLLQAVQLWKTRHQLLKFRGIMAKQLRNTTEAEATARVLPFVLHTIIDVRAASTGAWPLNCYIRKPSIIVNNSVRHSHCIRSPFIFTLENHIEKCTQSTRAWRSPSNRLLRCKHTWAWRSPSNSSLGFAHNPSVEKLLTTTHSGTYVLSVEKLSANRHPHYCICWFATGNG